MFKLQLCNTKSQKYRIFKSYLLNLLTGHDTIFVQGTIAISVPRLKKENKVLLREQQKKANEATKLMIRAQKELQKTQTVLKIRLRENAEMK